MIDGVFGQLVEQAIERQLMGFEGDMTGQIVEQADQHAMLLVNRRQPRIEVVIPRKNIDGIDLG